MKFNKSGIKNEKLIELYTSILTPRLVEEKMMILLRQGKISKWFSGIGHIRKIVFSVSGENEWFY